MQHGMQFQQRFVYTSQFLRAEILVIDSATHASIINEGQRAYCIEQVMVSNFTVCEVGDCFPREEEAIQGRDTKFSTALLIAEFLHHESQSVEQIGVAGANTLFSQSPQTRSRIVQRIAFASNKVSIRVKEDVAILRDEQHEQPIDKAQYLAVVVLCV